MRLIEITVENFRNFEGEHILSLNSLNLFFGKNGAGKSAFMLDSVLFALYGHSPDTLQKLVSIGQSKMKVNLVIEQNNKTYSITREVPSKLTVLEDAIPVHGSIKIKQEFINEHFNDLTWFKKFRLFDVVAGINILEEGQLSLKKNFLSFNEDKLNTLRLKLMELKRERDIYNIKNIQILPHSPSVARKNVLTEGINAIKNMLSPIKNKINQVQTSIRTKSYKLGGLEQTIKMSNQKINNIKNVVICPTCNQKVENSYKADIEKEVKALVSTNKQQIDTMVNEIEKDKTELASLTTTDSKYQKHLVSAQKYLQRLENRLQQIQYIWTPRDLEVIKKCISEIDNFYSFYLLEVIQSIEPLINHILSKINFEFKFILNDKGNFDFIINKENKEFTYQQLSRGQKLIVSMAVKMALLLEKGESGLIISDEGMSSLSEENLTLMFELIQEYPFQLLAVVHRYENPPSFLKLFEVKKGSVQRV